MEHIHFKKLMKFQKCVFKNFSLLHDQTQEQEIVLLIIFTYKNCFKNENMGQLNFKKPFEFHSFSEMFYCGMTRLRNTDLGVFIQCQETRTILRKKNMEQSLFKKHSKFQNFDEIIYCGKARLSKMNLDVFTQCQVQEPFFFFLKYGTESVQETLKILKF